MSEVASRTAVVEPVNIDVIMNQPERVRTWRRAAEAVADRVAPLVDLSRPYVDGLQNLPSDGRFLLVGNRTQGGVEALLIPYLVRRVIGMRVRPLADRGIGRMRGPVGDLFAATTNPFWSSQEAVARSPSSRVKRTPCAGRAVPVSLGCPSRTTTRSCPSG
ncbi:MAG: hypothetical protein QOK02_4194 [Mycobacterium sp.]|jgi:1-acyl-sn-glycerol-3-phosphate acyltransferase|nr:hypothetical protein [Mycobacterium sp.]